MQLAAALYYQLSSSTGVTAYTSQRIFPMQIPQGETFPCLTYQQISKTPTHASQSDASLSRFRFQVSTWAETYASARTVARGVENALKDFSGTLGGTSGVSVQRIFFEMEYDLPRMEPNEPKMIYHIPQDYIIWSTT